MLWYIMFILIYNTFCFAQKFDVYENSGSKPVDATILKRQITNTLLENNVNEPTIKDLIPNSSPLATKSDKLKFSGKQNVIKLDPENNQIKSNPNNETVSNLKTNFTSVNISDVSKPTSIHNDEHSKDFQGAALRGFYVFLGLSTLIIIYFVIKSFRLRPGAPPPATVRKYGIVGRRSDMEMLPLPLMEEEDDDTVFDMETERNIYSNY